MFRSGATDDFDDPHFVSRLAAIVAAFIILAVIGLGSAALLYATWMVKMGLQP